ncbi:MAG TPA: GtrA family protein [Verrucomicrobiae bacterium]|nr:GtrA family protein [Verrucomicrobiae bacterium]
MFETFRHRIFGSRINWHRLGGQFAKYMAGGTLYFWVGYGVFALCYSGLHWSWLPAKVLSDTVGWTLNYLVQRLWAFKGQVHLSEMEHAGRYVFIESIGFILDYLMIWGLKSIGISPYVGFFISAGFFTVWSFFWYKYWVFPETGGKKPVRNTQIPA